jgi:hypothetical protein
LPLAAESEPLQKDVLTARLWSFCIAPVCQLQPNTFTRISKFNAELSFITLAETAIEAELSCVVLGLSEITARWTSLNEYLGTLVAQDFMKPKSYSKFLFDDENFTLSIKYFWAIGCLGEFIDCIKDNI